MMALRARLRAPGAEWVRDSARATGVPIFSLRTPSDATLVKARRPDPAPADAHPLTVSWQAPAGMKHGLVPAPGSRMTQYLPYTPRRRA